jgi:hypothetical protein
MSGCPNSTEGGCRCPEHHPGLAAYVKDSEQRTALAQVLEPHRDRVRLRVVTPGPATADTSVTENLDAMLAEARASCATCGGDAARCNAGTGPPDFRRLYGCVAWAPDGEFVGKRARPQPRQPWEARPSRTAA